MLSDLVVTIGLIIGFAACVNLGRIAVALERIATTKEGK